MRWWVDLLTGPDGRRPRIRLLTPSFNQRPPTRRGARHGTCSSRRRASVPVLDDIPPSLAVGRGRFHKPMFPSQKGGYLGKA